MSKKPKYENLKLTAKPRGLFESTDPENIQPFEIKNIKIEKLHHFNNHPFKLYEGQKLKDMCDSIKEDGVIVPIIVRPIDDENYEILSGHNRTEAAKIAGLEVVPAIIRENLTDEEAMLIVTVTNLIQRSFSDLLHSERAITLSMYHETVKSQGKRTDLVQEVEKISNNADFETSGQLALKLSAREKAGKEYGLSGDTVKRYVRINKLIGELKKRLDDGEFGIVPAVDISYLSDEEQKNLNDILDNSEYKLDMKNAVQLRIASKDNKLTSQIIEDILSGVALKKKNRASLPVQSLKIGGKKLSKYFKPEQKPEEIEAEIFEALEFFREHKKE